MDTTLSINERNQLGNPVLWTGTAAGLVGCLPSLVYGIGAGWPLWRVVLFSLLMLLYLWFTVLPGQHSWLAQTICDRSWLYLLLFGLLAFGLQTLSADPFLQPIVFSVPLVHAAFRYELARCAVIASGYLGLIALGLYLGGQRDPTGILMPLLGYGALFFFMYGFTRLLLVQAEARARADQLAAALAYERDQLRRLSEATIALSSRIELAAVLELAVTEGRALAGATAARVWLCREAGLLLAAACPELLEAVPEPDRAAPHVLELLARGESVGLLEFVYQSGTSLDPRAVQTLRGFAAAAAVAITNAHLYEQSRLSATLAERNRLARELHDTIAQGLTAISMQLDAAQKNIDRDLQRARVRLARAQELAHDTLEDVRRSVWDLAAPLIDGSALAAVLSEEVARFGEQHGINAGYRHSGPPPTLDTAAASQVLRIVQEALKNIEKHAAAQQVDVFSQMAGAELVISVRDNGRGFLPGSSPSGGGGFGLLSLRERARLAGGTLEVESAPGMGTLLRLRIPREQ